MKLVYVVIMSYGAFMRIVACYWFDLSGKIWKIYRYICRYIFVFFNWFYGWKIKCSFWAPCRLGSWRSFALNGSSKFGSMSLSSISSSIVKLRCLADFVHCEECICVDGDGWWLECACRMCVGCKRGRNHCWVAFRVCIFKINKYPLWIWFARHRYADNHQVATAYLMQCNKSTTMIWIFSNIGKLNQKKPLHVFPFIWFSKVNAFLLLKQIWIGQYHISYKIAVII